MTKNIIAIAVKGLEGKDGWIRVANALALQGVTDPVIEAALMKRLLKDKHWRVRVISAVILLETTNSSNKANIMKQALKDKDPRVRLEIIHIFKKHITKPHV